MRRIRELLTGKELSLTLGADRRAVVTAIAFVAGFCVFEAVWFRENFAELVAFFGRDDTLVFSAVLALYLAASVYLLFVLVLLAISARWYYRAAIIAFFTLTVFAQFGYSNALGRFIIAQDLISAVSATSEQKADSVRAFSSYVSLLPGLVLTAVSVFFRRGPAPFGGVAFVGMAAAYAVFYVNVALINPLFFDQRFASSSVGNFCLATADYLLYEPVLRGPREREKLEFAADQLRRPTNNIVFVFDESVRGDHLSLNGYKRPTTPYLEELAARGLLINYGIAVSASTISHPSYDAMISGATPEQIETLKFQGINTLPNLFQYAKAMNYRTHLFDGQMKTYWGGVPDDLNYIDDFVSLAEIDNPNRIEDWELGDRITNEDNQRNALKQWEIDNKIAGMVNRIFSESTGNFIFIYKRGCHFPYEKNYPEEAELWRPVYRFREQYEIPPADQIEAVKNSYDNSLRHNLDPFFKALSPDYSDLPNDTVIIYTSDHGESFFANGRAGHGGESREEAMVPLFVLGDRSGRFDPGFRASHANLFTTLLDLMEFPVDKRSAVYARSLLGSGREHSAPRFFNPPKSQRVLFDQ